MEIPIESPEPSTRPRVLLVDDEINILTACQRALRRELFDVVLTTSVKEAVQLLSENRFAVVVSDLRMPDMSGTQFLEIAKQRSPETIRIILTGHADIQSAVDAINKDNVYRFVTKPWSDSELRLTIRNGVARYGQIQETKKKVIRTEQTNHQLKSIAEGLEKKVHVRTQEISSMMQQVGYSLLGTVKLLSGVLDIFNPVIGNHCLRVGAFSRELGIRLGYSSQELLELEVAAKLHDIGKVSVSHQLLVKEAEGTLTPEEYQLVLMHALKGTEILEMIPEMKKAALYVRHHHEWEDGRGFPNGLKGKDIPLGSRIIAVASAFDHLLHDPVHGREYSVAQAVATLQSKTPDQFSPRVMEALEALASERQTELGDEIEICVRELRPEMVLSCEVRSAQGILLYPKGATIRAQDLDRLKAFKETNPFADIIHIYRNLVG